MNTVSRWSTAALLATGVGMAAFAAGPAHAQSQLRLQPQYQPQYQTQSQDQLTRVIIDVADAVLRGGDSYYRWGYADRVSPTNRPVDSRVKCDKRGKCKATYYDPRYDRGRNYGNGYNSNGYQRSRYARASYNDGNQGRDHDDRFGDDDDD